MLITFYQRVSIASYASAGIARAEMSVCLSVRLSVRPSVTLRYCIKTKKGAYDFNDLMTVMISSPSESVNILVSRNIWFITKFERCNPEPGRFLRLGWVQTADFGDFSTNKPPYLRGGVKRVWGRRKWRFSLLSRVISSEPSHSRPQLLYCTM